MKKIVATVFPLLVLTLVAARTYSQESLHKRLGRYDAVAAVTDDFIGRVATNKDISGFLVGLSDDSKRKVRQYVVDFLCNKSGGPCAYTGRTMKDTHKGLR